MWMMKKIPNNKLQETWHWTIIAMHWLTAFLVFMLFILGLWMVELNYYDDWYRKAPDLHRGFGIVLFLITLLRFVVHKSFNRPTHLAKASSKEIIIVNFMHVFLYMLLIFVMLSGYLISTADGRSIEFFGWIQIPATIFGYDAQEDIAGDFHFWSSVTLILFIALHAMAALKHHFINKDHTLKRMLGL